MEHNNDNFKTYDISDISKYFNGSDIGNKQKTVVYYEVDDEFASMNAPVRILGLTIALCVSGEGEVGIGMKKYTFKKNSLMMLSPNQYVQSFRSEGDVKVKVIGCNLEIVENIMPKLSGLLPVLIHNPMEAVIRVSDMESEMIQEYMSMIQSKLMMPKTPFKRAKVTSLLQSMLSEILEFHYTETDGTERPGSRKEEILSKFIIEVLQHFRAERSVSFYADRLCMTPKHLSAVCKEITSRTASELIDHYVIMEAKIMLSESDLTIQEIAMKLNFANQSFFGKYFKHLSGMSPSQFRKKSMTN